MSPSFYVENTLALFRENFFKVLERYPPIGEGDQRPLVSKIITQ